MSSLGRQNKINSSKHAEEARRVLASVVENSDDAIITKSLKGRILSWNAAAEKLFGYSQKEMIGRPITKIIPTDRRAEERLILSRLRRGERVDHYETVRIGKRGRLIDVSISVSPIKDSAGRITGACKIARDISSWRIAEETHRRSEQLLRAILDTAADAIITIDQRGLIRSANSATERLFGYSAAELAGENIKKLMPQPFRGEHDGYLRQYCRTGNARIIGIGREVTGQRKDGTTFPMHLSVSEVRLTDQRLFTGIVHDLTERRRLERQIMEVAANEQRRIGQDLHDGLCQDLIGVAFGIDAAARNMSGNADRASMEKLAASVRDAAGQARRLAHGLNPVNLKAGGLSAALENLASKLTESFGVQCSFQWDHVAQVHEDATATHLYRLAQEAISNAIRHGKASRIQISLMERGSSLTLSVTDNGTGMPQAIADSVKLGIASFSQDKLSTGGMGLQTMHYRARVIGGTFSVQNNKRGGTTITCTISPERPSHPMALSDQPSGNIRRSKRTHS